MSSYIELNSLMASMQHHHHRNARLGDPSIIVKYHYKMTNQQKLLHVVKEVVNGM